MVDDAIVMIATYNEAATIGYILDGLRRYRVIVVDDDSPDGTAGIAERYPNAHVVVRRGVRGIATAYLHGFEIALGRYHYSRVVQMDAGGTHDPALVPEMLARALQTHLLIGSRFVKRPRTVTCRTLLSLGAAALMRARGVWVQDATSGFRVWRADLLRAAIDRGVRARGFAFQLELLWNAHELGAMIDEYPIPYRLTNSHFRPGMIWEALRVVGGLA